MNAISVKENQLLYLKKNITVGNSYSMNILVSLGTLQTYFGTNPQTKNNNVDLTSQRCKKERGYRLSHDAIRAVTVLNN